MSDLFSKEYLQDLLRADGLAGAAKKTAETLAEDALGRAVEGKSEAARTRVGAGVALVQEARASGRGAELFSPEYLRELMDSDDLKSLVTGRPSKAGEDGRAASADQPGGADPEA